MKDVCFSVAVPKEKKVFCKQCRKGNDQRLRAQARVYAVTRQSAQSLSSVVTSTLPSPMKHEF